jgi:hypothetical protein
LKKRRVQVSEPSSTVTSSWRRGLKLTSLAVTTASICASSPSRASHSRTMRVSSS